MINKLNKVQIHCWGGLGSQLNAWAIAEAIQQKFKQKSVEIVLHTGGVTKRTSNIEFLAAKFKIKIFDDFQKKTNSIAKLPSSHSFIRRTLKYFLDRSGLILTDEKALILPRIKQWTLSIRGHYSNEMITDQVLYSMLIEIERYRNQKISPLIDSKNYLGIHYRLGDLLQLEEKSFINPEVLGKFFIDFRSTHIVEKVHVYSDSLNFAQTSLRAYISTATEYFDKEIWDTLIELCNYKYFIGTNSKISIWVSLFRSVKNTEANVCLPFSMKDSLNKIYPKILKTTSIVFY